MAKQVNQKAKLLYLLKILREETDDDHSLTVAEIADRLSALGISADRKTLYSDFEELRTFGEDIVSEKIGRNTYYHIGAREFELSELKLLVDSVQSARFITDRKSAALIRKLETLTSRHQAGRLQRQVTIAGRVKTMNESIYYSVDRLYDALADNVQIRFHYFRWNAGKEMELRKDGAWYQVSPWGLLCDNENYYLIAFDAEEERIKHYRVDKMLHIHLLAEPRQGQEAFKGFDLARYSRSLFGMFSGEEVYITMEADSALAGVLIDRFGRDIPMISLGPDRIRTTVLVALSPQFLGWVIALGSGIRITGPEHVVDAVRKEGERIVRMYAAEKPLEETP